MSHRGHGNREERTDIMVSASDIPRVGVAVRPQLPPGQTVRAGGQYVRLDGVALDWPPAAVPPLLVGARGPRTLALAGELADGVVLDADISPDGVRRSVATAGTARPPEVVVYLPS